MTGRDRIVARIVRLQALASSQNEHEAASARKAAQRLMVGHGIVQSEVDAASGADRVDVQVVGDWGADWRYALITAAARHCGAEVFSFRVGRGRRVRMGGRQSDVDKALDLFKSLQSAVWELRIPVYVLLRGSGDVELDFELAERGWKWCLDRWHRGCARGIVEILKTCGRSSRSPGLIPWRESLVTPQPDKVVIGSVRLGVKVVSAGISGEVSTSTWYRRGRESVLEQIKLEGDGVVKTNPSARSMESFFWD